MAGVVSGWGGGMSPGPLKEVVHVYGSKAGSAATTVMLDVVTSGTEVSVFDTMTFPSSQRIART